MVIITVIIIIENIKCLLMGMTFQTSKAHHMSFIIKIIFVEIDKQSLFFKKKLNFIIKIFLSLIKFYLFQNILTINLFKDFFKDKNRI